MDKELLWIENYFGIVIIIQIVINTIFLLSAIQKDSKSSWIRVFSFEGLFIILDVIMNIYTFKNDYSGWEGFNISFIIVASAIINSVFIIISYCIKIIRFEKNNKKQNKKSMNPIIMIIGITCILVGIYYSSYEIYQNRGYKGKIDGTITSVFGGSNGHFAVISYYINGEKYEDVYINMNITMKKGEKINLPYYCYESKYHLHDYYQYKQYYIPFFITGVVFLVYRFIHDKDSN